MIKSYCIKNNRSFVLDYLLNQLQQTNLDGIYISKNNFKNYKNLIIHSTGKCQDNDFIIHIASALSNTILTIFEPQLIKKIISTNYFYFSDIEKKHIIDDACITLNSSPKEIFSRRKKIIDSVTKYLLENKTLNLDGFITFRLQNYKEVLDEAVDLAVDKFIIEKEYNEFISLLKLYIGTKESTMSELHLIYNNYEAILLDTNHNKINTFDHVFDAKYLSDITFSTNDYALNTILTIIPQKLHVHLVNSKEDEFISTLKLIFEERIQICKGCPLCDIYNLRFI